MGSERADAETVRRALCCSRPGCECQRLRRNRHCPVSRHGRGRGDVNPSLSVTSNEGDVLVHCHGGCSQEAVIDALRERELWPRGMGGSSYPPNTPATLQPCNLANYGAAKGLPVDFLVGLGLSDVNYLGRPAIRIPYAGADGTEGPVRFRLALGKGADGTDDRFRWKSGSKLQLYGLNRLGAARRDGSITLVEGESDAQTLWLHSEPAAGVPGAGNWRNDRDAPHLDDIGIINVVVEPDGGGVALLESLRRSGLRDQIRVVRLGAHKDQWPLPGRPRALP